MKIFSILPTLLALNGSLASSSEESLAALRGSTTRNLGYYDYRDCFYNVKDDTAWPLDGEPKDLIPDDKDAATASLGFGPYDSYCDDTEHFHPGVTIHGSEDDNVCAIYSGTVKSIWGEAGSYTVVLEHTFDESCQFQGQHSDKWYSVYRHLKTVDVDVNDVITVPDGDTCIVLGKLGTHTCADGTPLHSSLGLQIRVGSHNSYKFCVENGDSNCFDPMVNPALGFGKQSSGFVLTTLNEASIEHGEDITVTIEQPANIHTLNRIEVLCEAGSQDTDPDTHALDFNLREGFELSDFSYDQDKTKPYIDVTQSTTNPTKVALVIPDGWIDCSTSEVTKCDVSAIDVWDSEKYVDFEIPAATVCTSR